MSCAVKSNRIAEKDIIFKTGNSVGKIYIKEEKGRYQQRRRWLNVVLFILFLGFPMLQYQGEQAILFDVSGQTLRLFSLTLFPQDLLVFALLFIFAAFVLFFVTTYYGRVWCGFTCPQTVWTLLFNWVERRIEGTHHQSRALDKGAWTFAKLLKKLAKHTIWVAIALGTATSFMAYFVPVKELYQQLFSLNLSAVISGWVIVLALCTYLNAGWLREKMCQHMCPYARFQSAMFGATTRLVTYNTERGEQRGPRKRNSNPEGLGDCVDCQLCVQVCPVGIDIRDGLQYECINCGLCVDACDPVMERFGYAKGLIRFQSSSGEKPAKVVRWGYGLMAAVTIIASLWWALSWQNFEVNIIRDRQALSRINALGQVENTYTIKLLNKATYAQVFELELVDGDGLQMLGAQPFTVPAGALHHQVVTVVAVTKPEQRMSDLRLRIFAHESEQTETKTTLFYSNL
ncbi:cytochrome c oxidase accessory protein CcoG [Pseudidiomarina sediminum]|uniref:Cytochrome c oxidase accessory protein CcoG n=1 Tax=Pseudidiomarina sediminum TaxID=431675 RepID=A0A432Z3A5_9GAMM|nr:cytochrome c oxidase accessory protein CcoG [Pseudidiomarina sediminum]